jgi:hypothetical protein
MVRMPSPTVELTITSKTYPSWKSEADKLILDQNEG